MTADELKEWIQDATQTGFLAFDTETTGLTPALAELVGISLAATRGSRLLCSPDPRKKADLLGMQDDTPCKLTDKEIVSVLNPYFSDPSILKIGHNAKYDLQMLWVGFKNITPLDDTMMLSYVVDGSSHGHGLDELALTFCGHKMISYDEVTGKGKGRISFAEVPIDKACTYAAEDADLTLRLHEILSRGSHRRKWPVFMKI